jgi:hypothetical protein
VGVLVGSGIGFPVAGVCFVVGESSIALPLLGVVFRNVVSWPTAPSGLSGSSSDSDYRNVYLSSVSVGSGWGPVAVRCFQSLTGV